ncbi:recombinase family protein [Planctomycetaceae bacterium]|nr:recombinase family protein [Planctomycetaceae bacterium]
MLQASVLQQLDTKPFEINGFCHSGCLWQSPVKSGCKGVRPGQNRDNLFVQSSKPSGLDFLWFICSAGLCLAAVASIVEQTATKARQLTRAETETEIQKLWDEYASHITLAKALQTGAIYARYSTRYQSSVIDQIRENLAFALRESIFILRDHIFFDLAVSGRKKRRPGLQAVDSCLDSSTVQVLIVFTTNRLHRRANRALEHVERLVKEQKKRVVFVMNHVDSQKDEKWKRFLQFLCLFDEFASEMYVENIRAAHIGKLINRMVSGTITFGYHGVEIPGSSNRNGKPDRRIEIHETSAMFVRQVFEWFTNLGLSINEIIRRLNEDDAVPLPPKSTNGRWTRLAIKTLLQNDRYRGEWSYGKKESVLLSEKDYIRQDERAEPLKTIQFEELRIVSDELFFKTQQRLQVIDKATNRGRKPAGQNQDRLPKILNGFYFCPEHDQRLHVGGPMGEYMICPACHDQKAKDRFLFSQLNRELALKKICVTLTHLIQGDSNLVDQIIQQCQSAVESQQKPDKGRLSELRKRKQKLKRSTGLLMRQEPDSDAEEQELEGALREKRIQLSQLEVEIARLDSAEHQQIAIPEPTEVREMLNELSETLLQVAEQGVPAENDQLRELLRCLTGGRIELFQQGQRAARKGWLQGRFKTPLLSVLSKRASNSDMVVADKELEVVIDFKAPDRDEEQIERAWELYQQDLMQKEIARQLGCSRSNVTRLLKKAAELHGVELEDGRKRRARLKAKQTEPPQYQLLSEESKKLSDEDNKSFTEIGRILNCSDTTAKKAYEYWYESRGLAVPTLESRREKHAKRAQQLRDEGWSDAAIGRELGVSGTTIRNWLD